MSSYGRIQVMNGKRGPKQKFPQRANVRLTEEQFDWLQKEAGRQNVTVADVVRKLIDRARGK